MGPTSIGWRRRFSAASVCLSLIVVGAACSSPRPATTATTGRSASSTAPAPATTVPADAGAWQLTSASPVSPDGPWGWDGSELLVAGGGCCDDVGTVDLATYTPPADTWSRLPAPQLTPRGTAAGAWTGTEMIVVGGLASPDGAAHDASPVTDGEAWNPTTGTWRPIAPLPVPLAGRTHDSFWTGTELLVWSSTPAEGSTPGVEQFLAYDPASDTWRILPTSGLSPRQGAVVVWAGTQLFVWGGLDGSDVPLADGARFSPATGRWAPLPRAPVPARGFAASAWTGSQVLLWGGQSGPVTQVGLGVAYTPSTDSWQALPLSPLRAKQQPTGVWSGHFFYVIGGAAGSRGNDLWPVPGPGAAAYDPTTRTWTVLPVAPVDPDAPSGGNGPTASGSATQRAGAIGVWTGTSVLVVGGYNCCSQGHLPVGIVWTPRSGRG